MKEMSEISDGPFEKTDISDGGLYPARFAVIGPKGYESLTMHEKQCEYVTEEMNMAFHEGRKSRDSELASKDARIKELEGYVDKLEDSLIDIKNSPLIVSAKRTLELSEEAIKFAEQALDSMKDVKP